jgi:integrase
MEGKDMANITKRTNKNGSTSYLIRAYLEEGPGGKQITKSTTWKPPLNKSGKPMSESAADKQAEKEAALFEDRIRSGVVSLTGRTKFEDYAARWMETADITAKTREQYVYLLKRINQAFGHITLEKFRTDHLKLFYKNLREAGVKESGYAIASALDKKRKELKLTFAKLAALSGVSCDTASAACNGERVSVKSAQKISAGLSADINDLFTVIKGTDTLSEQTVWHYHKLIRAILSGAEQDEIVTRNVASKLKGAPTQPNDEAAYYTDDEAKAFLLALSCEPDIRIRTVLTLDLFTGLRRGELCGLSWENIDFFTHTVHVRKESQYITGQGVTETSTKNKSSTRAITVSPFVTSLLADYQRWWINYKFSIGDAWKGEQNRLFIQSNGKPLFPATINYWMRKFIARNNLPAATPHTLRHTFASLQLANGVDIKTLQARTGHALASTLLNVYAHVIQSAQERAAQVMDDVLLPENARKKA